MSIGRWFVALSVAAGLGFVAVPATNAQEDVCATLEARLAVLDSSQESYWNNQFQAYDLSVEQERRSLDRLNARAMRTGCFNGGLAQKRFQAKCGAIMQSIEAAQARLETLEGQSRQFGGDPYATERQRSKVLRALEVNRCGSKPFEAAADQSSRRFLTTVFGRQRYDEPLEHRGYYSVTDLGFGTFRTLCVRTCDGYYFPVSYSTVEEQFPADERACRAMCPGADVKLYAHLNPGQNVDAMLSLAGEPYTALPTAFRFRKEFNAACTCRGDRAPADANASPVLVPLGDGPRTEIVMTAPAHLVVTDHAAAEETPPPPPAAVKDADPGEPSSRVAEFDAKGRPIRVVGPSTYIAQ